MREQPNDRFRDQIEQIYQSESRRVFATLIRLLGDFDRAEDALHDAFAAALRQWPVDGIPANPRAWLISTGRFKSIDSIRRQVRFSASLAELASRLEPDDGADAHEDAELIEDDRLRLIFTCCNPALSPDARIALTLREVCGLTTEEIARNFLTSPSTLAQRIVRAKAKIRDAHIPYQVPSAEELPERLDAVLKVVYLVFTEGYAASSGDSMTRPDLSGEAIRLGRLLAEMLPEPEVLGLLGLMLLHESRRLARTSPDGDLILLEDQDRSLWDRKLIDEGLMLVRAAFQTRRFGAYAIQGAIAGLHAEAGSAADTDWAQIAGLYDVLRCLTPSPVIELNRAAAIAMRDGPAKGLSLIDDILACGDLSEYSLIYSARGALLARLGRQSEAARAYQQALRFARQEPERRFLLRTIEVLGCSATPVMNQDLYTRI